MAASILALSLGFASSNDFSGLIIAATRAYSVGELARSALRACTRVQGVQTVVCAPFVAAGLRSLALWHAHKSFILTMSEKLELFE
jgi:hypothetical protein